MTRFILDTTTVVCIGMLTGVEFVVATFINPILRKLGSVMPLLVRSEPALILEIASRRGNSGEALLIVSGTMWAAVMVLTILFLVPINNRLAAIDPASQLSMQSQGTDAGTACTAGVLPR